MSIESGGGLGFTARINVYVNNGAAPIPGLHVHRAMSGGGGDEGSLGLSGLAIFTAGTTVEVWAANDTNTNNILIPDISLTVSKVGEK
jgi:hypothetical protein